MNPILYHPSIYLYLFTQKQPSPAYVSFRCISHWLSRLRTPEFWGCRGINSRNQNNGCHALSRCVTCREVCRGVTARRVGCLDPSPALETDATTDIERTALSVL